MLLRLEVDGFKNLVDFSAEFGPLTGIAGENGVGKSNVFDAIEFLARSADGPLTDAARWIRSGGPEPTGEPALLFTAGREADRPTMRFAVEVIVPRTVVDDLGEQAAATTTLLRYELEVGLQQAGPASRQSRIVVEREELRHLTQGEAPKHIRFPHRAAQFRKEVVTGRRTAKHFISTLPDGTIAVHQDGGSRGRPKRLRTGAKQTVVSTVNSTDDPTILALRRELQSWRRLALEPSALRRPDEFSDPDRLASDGRHLAAVLHRLAVQAGSPERADEVCARIASRLSRLVDVGIRTVRVDVDHVRELLSIVVGDRNGRELPARSLSEGTLRFLALCVLLEDPQMTGLLLMEEPENGIHPANLAAMVELLRDLAVDPSESPGPDNPMRQVLVNTHSPGVVQLMKPEDVLLAREQPLLDSDGARSALRLHHLSGTWRATPERPGLGIDFFADYLLPPAGAQLRLPLDDVA